MKDRKTVKSLSKQEINNELSSGSKTKPETKNTKIYELQQRKIMQNIIDLAGPISKDPPALLEHQNESEQEQKEISNNTPTAINSEIKSWTTVHRRKTQKKQLGQGEDKGGKFGGITPKVWMYIYRVNPNVTKHDIADYIKRQTGENEKDIIVNELKNDMEYFDNDKYKCYMVGADFKFKDNFYIPSFWPRGVGFKRFNFKVHAKYIIKENSSECRPESFLEM